jgi:site-specific recombinase XerD
MSTRQYARLVHEWVGGIGLQPQEYGTRWFRRPKRRSFTRRHANLRAAQILFGHAKIESTVRYLGVDVEDAWEFAERTEV